MNHTYRAVLFDLDGTLIPSLPLWLKAFHSALGHYGLQLSDEEIIKRCFYQDWGQTAAAFFIPTDEFVARVRNAIELTMLEAELYPQAQALLRYLQAQEVKLALVTSSPRAIVESLVQRLQISSFFAAVICGGDVEHYKPHPLPLVRALEQLKQSAADAIMVGDSSADMLAGRAAGTTTALFLPEEHVHFHSIDVLHSTKPDFVFSEHAQLPRLLGL